MPAYAPPVFKNAAFGYMMSALTGCGLILLAFLLCNGSQTSAIGLPIMTVSQIPGEIRP